MASISNDPNGRRRILFMAPDGRRRAISLGKVSKRQAESIRLHLENLVASLTTGHAPPDETSRWVAALDDKMTAKLARVGLVAPRRSMPLTEFLTDYVEKRSDVKPATVTVYGHTRRCLIDFFGADKPLRDITPGDADDWSRWLASHEGLAHNTVRRRCGIAKQFFKAAERKGLILRNPFAELKAAVTGNPKRLHFVARADAERILDTCPSPEWKLIFALARYGGIRVPSELLALRWEHVNWERNRITVPSPKTAHHVGHESRTIPLFPELRPYLMDMFETAEPGTEYIITTYRRATQNLRTQLLRIIRRAGVEPWPKLFHNLRASRETELAEKWPMHVVCAWIGNSQSVAMRHYLSVTEDHFNEATQKTAQYMHEMRGNVWNQQIPEAAETDPQPSATSGLCQDMPVLSHTCKRLEMGDDGLEPPTSSL